MPARVPGLITSRPARRQNGSRPSVNEAREVLPASPRPAPAAKPTSAQYSSPACSMHEVSDVLHGYAGKEVPHPLAQMSCSRRSGRELASHSRARTRPARDGSRNSCSRYSGTRRWCHARGSPEGARRAALTRTGEFHGKAMAIVDLRARLAFLNRGQGWVVRKLREMLPRVRNDEVARRPRRDVAIHEINIDRANEVRAAPDRRAAVVDWDLTFRSRNRHPPTGTQFGAWRG